MLCGLVWPVGLREAFLGVVLASQEAPANLAAQSVVRDPAAPASPQSLLEMQNHGLISVPLNQNRHMNKTLVIHRHEKVWEVLALLSCLKPAVAPHCFLDKSNLLSLAQQAFCSLPQADLLHPFLPPQPQPQAPGGLP